MDPERVFEAANKAGSCTVMPTSKLAIVALVPPFPLAMLIKLYTVQLPSGTCTSTVDIHITVAAAVPALPSLTSQLSPFTPSSLLTSDYLVPE